MSLVAAGIDLGADHNTSEEDTLVLAAEIWVHPFGVPIASGSAPVLLSEEKIDQHPLQLRVLGSHLHVSGAKGLPWALCASGLLCGLGQSTEVLKLAEGAGAMERLGSYGGEHQGMAHAAFTGDLVILPAENGLRVKRAEALP